jgi:hypothetical protein
MCSTELLSHLLVQIHIGMTNVTLNYMNTSVLNYFGFRLGPEITVPLTRRAAH